MPGLRGLADDHDGTAQPGPGDQAAEQAGQPVWRNRLPSRAVNTDPVSVRLVPAAAWSAVDPAP